MIRLKIVMKLRGRLKKLKSILLGYINKKSDYKSVNEQTIFLCGIPEYGNTGDQAITISEISLLRIYFLIEILNLFLKKNGMIIY